MTLELVVATGNLHKLKEFTEILKGRPFRLLSRADFTSWPDIVETSVDSYLENARIKAHGLCDFTGLPAIADDSGIEVDALDGAPGPLSARFSGPGATDETNNAKLIRLLEGVPEERRSARYRAVVVAVFPEGDELAAVGTVEGRIGFEARGDRGFGYDPWFIPVGGSRTMAELSGSEKHAISHRGQALRAVADLIEQRIAT